MCETAETTSLPQALAPRFSPGPWEVLCALDRESIVDGIIRDKTTHAIPDIFSATLIVLDLGLLSFDSLREELFPHKVELVRGRDMITSLQAHDGQEYSEAEVVCGILEVKERVQLHCWKQASIAYDIFVQDEALSFCGKSRACCRS